MTAATVFARLEATPLAKAIGGSTMANGLLSGVHLIGMTMIAGGSLVFAIRTFRDGAHPDAVAGRRAPEQRAVAFGAAVSILTGVLLALPRLSTAFANPVFRIKMLVLVAAVSFDLVGRTFRTRTGSAPPRAGRIGVVTTVVLWYSVVALGCAFILWE